MEGRGDASDAVVQGALILIQYDFVWNYDEKSYQSYSTLHFSVRWCTFTRQTCRSVAIW